MIGRIKQIAFRARNLGERVLIECAARAQRNALWRKFPEERTSATTCVIGNAVPKSGTYLLNAILRFLDQ